MEPNIQLLLTIINYYQLPVPGPANWPGLHQERHPELGHVNVETTRSPKRERYYISLNIIGAFQFSTLTPATAELLKAETRHSAPLHIHDTISFLDLCYTRHCLPYNKVCLTLLAYADL